MAKAKPVEGKINTNLMRAQKIFRRMAMVDFYGLQLSRRGRQL